MKNRKRKLLRRKLCEWAFKLHLYQLSYHLSPSIYYFCLGQVFQKNFMDGFKNYPDAYKIKVEVEKYDQGL